MSHNEDNLAVKSTSSSLFPEREQALHLAHSLGSSSLHEEQNLFHFDRLLQPYQERPQALDDCLSELCAHLMNRINSPCCSRALYLLCKIRGRKAVARQLPKRADALDECLTLLYPNLSWETNYVGLVWLSLLILLPFDLDTVTESTIHDIQSQCAFFLVDSQAATREPASLALAKLLVRPDCKVEMLEFLQREAEEQTGLLLTKAAIFKRTTVWAEVEPMALQVFPSILARCEATSSFDALPATQRKLYVKILQRTFTTNLPGVHIDALVTFLLTSALSDVDSRVRWQAAKTMRMLSNKLTGMRQALFAEVLAVLDEAEEEDIWHGACLALGEMLRVKTKESVPVYDVVHRCVCRALGFDRKRGARYLGSNVRDAGCYVAWAMVRVISKADFEPQVAQELLQALVVASLFDREVSCRRAAAAALQEAVGRLGREIFPTGIELLQLVHYQSVGNLGRAYVEVCDTVCALDDLRQVLTFHLLDVRTRHWDEQIRVLAAKAIGRSVKGAEEVEQVVRQMCGRLEAASVLNQFEFHGTMLVLAELVGRAHVDVRSVLIKCATWVVSAFPSSLTMVRVAWCRLAEAEFSSQVALSDAHRGVCESLLEECLRVEATAGAARNALGEMLKAFGGDSARWMGTVPGAHALLRARIDVELASQTLLDCMNSSASHLARVACLRALVDVESKDVITQCVLLGLHDESRSNQHGDVGSWVRRQACLSLCELRMEVSGEAVELISQLACDKLDHVREAALRALLMSSQREAFPCTLEEGFSLIQNEFLLKVGTAKDIRRGILRGLVLTAGSLNESPSEAAQGVLQTWLLADTTVEHHHEVWDEALSLLRKDDLNVVPVCNALTFVLWNVIHLLPSRAIPSQVWVAAVVDRVTSKPKKKNSVSRQVAVAYLLLGLSSLSSNNDWVWEHVASRLCSPFPSLRRQVGEAVVLWVAGGREQSEAVNIALELMQGEDHPGELELVKRKFLEAVG